jgi:peptidoglycan/LPS O-acetylase OafA/YrhL
MNFQTMSKQRKMILIASAVGFIALFLPWASFFGISVNGMRGWGIVLFLCFLGAGVLAFMGDQTKNLDIKSWTLALIAGGVAALVMVISFLSSLDVLGYMSIGFYLALAAAVALPVLTYQNRSAGDTVQAGVDALKGTPVNTTNTTTGTTTTTNVVNPTSDPTKPVI